MNYRNVIKGKFISRPNRFIAKVEIDGKEETVHVKNTGRCKEIFIPDATVYLEKSDNPQRKTKYDLIAVEKICENGRVLINIDSQIPNFCAEEFLLASNFFPQGTIIKREVTFGNSRFDICAKNGDEISFIEVKGVTLEKDGLALFPDAPTERGVKHIKELIRAKNEGYGAYIMFVIQMTGVSAFSPYKEMHPDFAAALKDADKAGVKILAFDCLVTKDSIKISEPVKVLL